MLDFRESLLFLVKLFWPPESKTNIRKKKKNVPTDPTWKERLPVK